MKNRTRRNVEETLARLGVEEVVERLEVSPIMLADTVPDEPADDCCCRCVCTWTPISLPFDNR